MPVEKSCEELGCALWKLVDEEMAPWQRRLCHVRATLAPLGRNIKQPSHLAGGTMEGERGAGDLAVDIAMVMFETDARGGAIVGARTMSHVRITPCPTILRNHFLIEVGNSGGPPADEAGLVEKIRIIADQALRERLRLRQEVPVPIRAGDLAIRFHEHRISRNDVHQR